MMMFLLNYLIQRGTPKLYKVVSNYMIHGPCGVLKPNSLCMKGKFCSEFFPKKISVKTTFDVDGYLVYKKTNFGVLCLKSGVELDKRLLCLIIQSY